MRSLLFMVIFCSWSSVAIGADWYVNAKCQYNGDGTLDTCATGDGQPGAWNSLSSIDNTSSGWYNYDTLYLFGDVTYTGTIHFGDLAQHNKTLDGSYGGGKAVIIPDVNQRQAVYTSQDYSTIKNVKVFCGWNGSEGAGIYAGSGANNLSIIYCEITNNLDQNIQGIHIGSASNNILLSSNIICNTQIGIQGSGGNITGKVLQNLVFDLTAGNIDGADGIRFVTGDYNGLTVTHNHIYNYGGDGLDFYGGSNATVEYNIIHDPLQESTVGNGIKVGSASSENNVIRYNYIYSLNARGDGSLNAGINTNGAVNSKIYYNVCIDCYDGIFLTSTDNQVYNNTIMDARHRGVRLAANLNVVIQNNLIYGTTGDYDIWVDSGGTITGGYNLLSKDLSVAGSSTYIGSEYDLYQVNPLLSGYHISRQSPARNAGTAILGLHKAWPNWVKDVDGDSVVDIPDIGADEFRIKPNIGDSKLLEREAQ